MLQAKEMSASWRAAWYVGGLLTVVRAGVDGYPNFRNVIVCPWGGLGSPQGTLVLGVAYRKLIVVCRKRRKIGSLYLRFYPSYQLTFAFGNGSPQTACIATPPDSTHFHGVVHV